MALGEGAGGTSCPDSRPTPSMTESDRNPGPHLGAPLSRSSRPARPAATPPSAARSPRPSGRADGAAPGNTTARQKAHGTEVREVLYPWHPWFGQRVTVVETFRRSDHAISRCRLDADPSGRALELPQWMLDRAACSRLRLAQEPLVPPTVLRRLNDILKSTRGGTAAGVVQDQHPLPPRGDADAPARNAPDSDPAGPLPRASHDTNLARAASGGAGQDLSPPGPPPPLSAPPPIRRRQRRGGAR